MVVGDKPIRASRKSAEWCLKSVDRCWSQKERSIRPSEQEEARKAYVLARRALAHWKTVDPPCQQREQEYWRLVRELEDEILATLLGRP